jgi:hypothetical protein
MTLLQQKATEPNLIDLPEWKVAEILNSPDTSLPIITQWNTTSIGFGDILTILGVEEGANFLDSLENLGQTYPPMKYAMQILEHSLFDVSNEIARQQIIAITQPPLNLLTLQQAEDILSISRVERHPSWAEYYNIEVTARTVGLAKGGK